MLPFLRHFRLERHVRIGGRRREHDRVVVDELRRRLVDGAEGDLRLLLRVEIEPEQLLVAADARVVDDDTCRRASTSARSRELVVGQVGDLLRRQVDREDVADRAAQRRRTQSSCRRARTTATRARPPSSSSMRCSIFRVSTFWMMSVRSFSVRTKYARRSPFGDHAIHGISNRSPSWTMWSKPMSLSKPLVRLRTIDPSLLEMRMMSISRSLRLNVIAAMRSPDGDGAIEKASANASSPCSATGRGRSRPAAPCRGTA